MTAPAGKGPLLMIVASFFLAAMGFSAKLISPAIPGAEVSFFRFALGVGATLALAAVGRADLRAPRKGLLIARGVLGGASILLLFLALSKGTLTSVMLLSNTYPIFATLAAALFLGERIGIGTGGSMAVAWLGIWLLIHPDFRRLSLPELVALASAVLAGGAVIIVRALRRRGESTWKVYFYLSLFGAAASFLAAVPVWAWPEARDAALLFLTACFGLAGQIALTAAYKYCSTQIGGILSMTTPVCAAFFGLIFLGERLAAGEIAGALLVVLGSAGALALASGEHGEGRNSGREMPGSLH